MNSFIYRLLVIGLVVLFGAPARDHAAEVESSDKYSACDRVDLGAVFQDPLAFNGRVICTHGYIAREGRFVAFYPEPGVDFDTMLGIALIPQSNSPEQLKALFESPQGTRFRIRGKLDIDRECILHEPGRSNYICTPVKKPLFLSKFEGAPAKGP